MRPPEDPLIGTLVADKYRVLEPIAVGGMARIYKAEQQPLGRIVALKVLLGATRAKEHDPAFGKRFFLEANTVAALKHPNTVTIHDYGQRDDGSYFMVMEYVEGKTLRQVLREEGTIEPARAVKITMEILRSLQEAHELGIVHRDLKAPNIMLVNTLEGESVKVLDFGIAKVMQAEGEDLQQLTMDDRIVGSPRYMAPEQIRCEGVDQRTDLYSLGILLYEMLVGRPPFLAPSATATLMKHLNKQPPSLSENVPYEIPISLENAVMACLQKDASLRPHNTEELRDRLRQCLAEMANTAVTRHNTDSLLRTALALEEGSQDNTLVTPGLAPESRRPLYVGGALAVITMLALGAVLMLPPSAPAPAPAPAPPAPAPEPVVVAPAPEPEVQAASITIHSQPEGAQVWHGNRMLGVTPLTLPATVGDAARNLQLRLDGHIDVALAVPEVTGDLTLSTALDAVPKVRRPKIRRPKSPPIRTER